MSHRRLILILIFSVLCVFQNIGSQKTSAPVHAHAHDQGHDDDEHSNVSSILSPLNDTRNETTRWQPYVYGTISVTIVSLLSLAGVIVIPFLKNRIAYDGVMLTFMSLAVGTMTSDAILHLIPETLGLDKHDEHEHAHGNEGAEHEHEENAYLGKMVALLGTLYGLYMLELILQTAASIFKKPKISSTTAPTSNSISLENGGTKVVSEKTQNFGGHSHGHGHSHFGDEIEADGPKIFGLKSVAFVIVLSDAMHNFTDGLAIGVAFSKSSAAGLGLSIAVVCHEIPHEIGNFAILLNTGMSLKKALLLNFLSAVTCFAGLYPGIVAGQQDVIVKWIFAAVAAGFLYVALVHMLRELQHFGSLPWFLSLILQNVGILVGFGIIFLLAVYEHDLDGLA